jgi:hypothetical protein
MAALNHIYIDTHTHIYITSILLFIPFFILLPLFWAGRLAQTLLVCHRYFEKKTLPPVPPGEGILANVKWGKNVGEGDKKKEQM